MHDDSPDLLFYKVFNMLHKDPAEGWVVDPNVLSSTYNHHIAKPVATTPVEDTTLIDIPSTASTEPTVIKSKVSKLKMPSSRIKSTR